MTAPGIAIVALLAPVVRMAAPVATSDAQELLAKVDVSYGRYGKALFGQPKVSVFKAKDGSVLLAHQARYGDDGDHSENRLMLFGFWDRRLKKVLDQNIDFVEFVEEAGTLKLIRGKDVESLCDVCDGWDAAEADDVFFIPIVVDVETLTVRADLSRDEKQRLLSRLEQRAARNLAEKRKYGRNYGAFAASVTDRVRGLLATGSGPPRTDETNKTLAEACKELASQDDESKSSQTGLTLDARCKAYEAEKKLNALYASYRKRLASKQKEQLKRAQLAWLEFRKTWCAFVSSGVEGGSAQPMVALLCEAEVTEARIKDLEAVSTCVEGDLSCPSW